MTSGLFVGATAVAADIPSYPETISPTVNVTEEPTEDPTKAPSDDVTTAPTDEPTVTPTDEPTEEPTDEPTDDPTEEPTDDPTDEPTEEPTDEPTDDPTEEPTDDPTDEPTDDPTDEPTEEPTVDPTTPVDPGPIFPTTPPVQQSPVISPIAPITAVSRDDLTEADLLRGLQIVDDVDFDLVAEITGWGDWFNPVECPHGYPCTYRIVYTVFDSHGNFDDAARDIIITGKPTSNLSSLISRATNDLIDRGIFDTETDADDGAEELPYTGIETEYLFGISAILLASGTGLILASRRKSIR
ncbi:LPXTG cell wall anchor domain-containing protein [Flaviflexus ciconiae]|uniref:LPXTG cell wall anchor domain-containing protein n=1 Tax=Flaviflexus ciconiae TaxID=2496867 RepID=A0A3Q9G7B2_9ACTO|nr:LPXTG cell wall anchor domain-containing protein [Flaviflexus ciconiae]AZQ76917.1 LPXTG cell wall anchor domain-containing protein [Flaviflexus ciconiae]